VSSGRNLCARITYARKVLILWWVGVRGTTLDPTDQVPFTRCALLASSVLAPSVRVPSVRHALLSPRAAPEPASHSQHFQDEPSPGRCPAPSPPAFHSRHRSFAAPGWLVRLGGEAIPIAAVPRSYVATSSHRYRILPLFPTQAHFVTTLRARLELTPGEYRRQTTAAPARA
jgi:hypothetical protein